MGNSDAPRGPGQRLLLLLKTRGPRTAAEVGAALGVSAEAARQQLAKLTQDGLVEATASPHGVGRPALVWRLTPPGHARFPDAHAELTVQLLNAIRSVLGEPALERLIAAREADARASYSAALAGAKSLEERVARLAAIRKREGYMAEWRRDGDAYLLIENHCPICAAASTCQNLCDAELAIFRRVLGPQATVTREEHIVSGARRCVYRVERARKRRASGARRPRGRAKPKQRA